MTQVAGYLLDNQGCDVVVMGSGYPLLCIYGNHLVYLGDIDMRMILLPLCTEAVSTDVVYRTKCM